jgi:Leucine-rich repeat (LRR) protein
MQQMNEIVLSDNRLRDGSMLGRAMRVVKTLKKLDLSRNEISDLRQGSFVDVINLENLDLSRNRLTELKRSALHRLPRLKRVDLSHNQIRSFHSDSFKDTPQVITRPL